MGATREALVEVALAHSTAEAEGDLDATMATLEDETVYELQPVGLKLVGRDRARRYYEWFFEKFAPRIERYEMRGEWINDIGVNQEYTLWVHDDDGTSKRFEIIGILVFGDTKLTGERLYASEELYRMMVGPVYDEAVPV